MKIEIDKKYLLTADSMNFIVQEKSTIKEGKNKGKECFVLIGYYSTVPAALMAVLRHKVRQSAATDIKTLISEYRAFYAYLKDVFNENDSAFAKAKQKMGKE